MCEKLLFLWRIFKKLRRATAAACVKEALLILKFFQNMIEKRYWISIFAKYFSQVTYFVLKNKFCQAYIFGFMKQTLD